MKKSLFLYLFIITALMLVFTYMYFSKQLTFEEGKYNKMNTKLNDSIIALTNKNIEADYFSLEHDDNALNYFENYSIDKLTAKIKADLIAYNDDKKGNKFTGQEAFEDGQKFIINKIKILNHRWIIADYSNGELWGEVLLKYFVNEDQTITFVIMDTYLFPKQ